MNKFLQILFFLFLTTVSFSQGWKKKYYLPNSLTSTSGNVIETPTGNFIAVGVTYDTLNNKAFNRLTLIGLDKNGNQLWRKNYGNHKFEYLNTFSNNSIKDNTGFYQTVCVKDSNNKYPSALIKFDFNGDTLWQKKYYSGQSGVNLYFTNLTKGVDGSLLMTGFYEDFNQSIEPCLVLKTNFNGTELWRKVINKNIPNVNTGYAILQDTSSKKIVITGYQYIGDANGADTYSSILFLDSLGNFIQRKTFNNAGGGGFYTLIQLKDKNFLTGGANLVNSNSSIYAPLLVKFDINGTILWSKHDLDAGYNNRIGRLIELASEDIVAVGSFDAVSNLKKMQFLKMNKLGKNSSKKYIGSAYVGSEVNGYNIESCFSFHTTSDKGFILASLFPYAIKAPHPYSVIKLDSTGCDTTEQWCTSVALGLEDKSSIRQEYFTMYPNPANEILNFELNAYAQKNITVLIRDVKGSEIEKLQLEPNTKVQVNTSAYPPGIYFVSTHSQGSATETKKLIITR